jgi:ABC-type multidrug transport system ATPase subunit
VSAVTVRGLVRRFGSVRVLDSIDLTVSPGSHVAITGANGAGKTTLLRVLAGLLRPTAGRVEVLGGTIDDPGVRKRIGFVGHLSSLYPRMTPLENIRFWSNIYDAPEATERGRELLAQLGLDPDDRRNVGSYSQGMRQRVAIVRALCIAPDLVIADEPLAGLDADGARVVASMLGQARTVVLATHDRTPFPQASLYALDRGRLQPIQR